MPAEQGTQEWDDILVPPPLHNPVISDGIIRDSAADFEVEEIPAFEPAGTGDHLFLWVQKRGYSTSELTRHIARTCGISSRDIGTAGQKDKHAVTRQWISVPASAASDWNDLPSEEITVLRTIRHTKKLRTGQLRGNRFQVAVRSPESEFTAADVRILEPQLASLQTTGFANYFGPQRFGHGGATLAQGLRLLSASTGNREQRRRLQPWLRRLALSAAQSAVFNRVTARRVAEGSIADPQTGDVVIRKGGTRPYRFDSSAETPDDAPTTEPPVRDPVIPAGPIPGPNMVPAAGSIAVAEDEVMSILGLSHASFEQQAKLCSGTRRPMLAFPQDCSCELTDDGRIRLGFTLSRGCYATVLLRELFTTVTDSRSDDTARLSD